MTAATETAAMPDVVVDRSPELKRGATASGHPGFGGKIASLSPEGVRGDGSSCALARVLHKLIPELKEAHVEGEHPYLLMEDGSQHELRLAPGVADWIGRFDRGEHVETEKITVRTSA